MPRLFAVRIGGLVCPAGIGIFAAGAAIRALLSTSNLTLKLHGPQ